MHTLEDASKQTYNSIQMQTTYSSICDNHSHSIFIRNTFKVLNQIYIPINQYSISPITQININNIHNQSPISNYSSKIKKANSRLAFFQIAETLWASHSTAVFDSN